MRVDVWLTSRPCRVDRRPLSIPPSASSRCMRPSHDKEIRPAERPLPVWLHDRRRQLSFERGAFFRTGHPGLVSRFDRERAPDSISRSSPRATPPCEPIDRFSACRYARDTPAADIACVAAIRPQVNAKISPGRMPAITASLAINRSLRSSAAKARLHLLHIHHAADRFRPSFGVNSNHAD